MSEKIQNKIELNLEPEVIGKIDTLIEEGLYKDRLSFLENAINQLLDVHQSTINSFQTKKGFVVGLLKYSSKDLEKIVAEGKKLQVRLIGGLILDHDISPELADRAIEKINIAGILRGSPEVKKILEPKHFTLLGNQSKLLLRESNDNSINWNEE